MNGCERASPVLRQFASLDVRAYTKHSQEKQGCFVAILDSIVPAIHSYDVARIVCGLKRVDWFSLFIVIVIIQVGRDERQ